MKKSRLFMALAALGLSTAMCSAAAIAAVEPTGAEAVSVYAEEGEKASSPAVAIDVKIGYRDSEDVSYVAGDSKIGSWFLSADGWAEGEDQPIILNAVGNVSTKLDGKVLYLYEYRPTNVLWSGKVVPQQADKTYVLEKPSVTGTYVLEIDFTKTLIQNPTELTSINWESLLTVGNLMTIVSWAVIVVGIVVLGIVNSKYRKKGSTTLDDVKKYVGDSLTSVVGEQVGTQLNATLSKVMDASLGYINEKLETLNDSNATLIRCFLLMQENTPEARLAVTKCLSELDLKKDGLAEEVKALIEGEIARNAQATEERIQRLEHAEELNRKWTNPEAEKPEEAEKPSDGDDGFGEL